MVGDNPFSNRLTESTGGASSLSSSGNILSTLGGFGNWLGSVTSNPSSVTNPITTAMGSVYQGAKSGLTGAVNSITPVISNIASGTGNMARGVAQTFAPNPMAYASFPGAGLSAPSPKGAVPVTPPGAGLSAKYTPSLPQTNSVPEYAKPLLDLIAKHESGGKYDIRYGGASGAKTFSDFSKHPNVAAKNPDGTVSTAAGRYQINKPTWDQYSNGLDFSPANQDKVAWNIAQDRYHSYTGKDLNSELQKNGVTQATLSSLTPTWAGLAHTKATEKGATGASWANQNAANGWQQMAQANQAAQEVQVASGSRPHGFANPESMLAPNDPRAQGGIGSDAGHGYSAAYIGSPPPLQGSMGRKDFTLDRSLPPGHVAGAQFAVNSPETIQNPLSGGAFRNPLDMNLREPPPPSTPFHSTFPARPEFIPSNSGAGTPVASSFPARPGFLAPNSASSPLPADIALGNPGTWPTPQEARSLTPPSAPGSPTPVQTISLPSVAPQAPFSAPTPRSRPLNERIADATGFTAVRQKVDEGRGWVREKVRDGFSTIIRAGTPSAPTSRPGKGQPSSKPSGAPSTRLASGEGNYPSSGFGRAGDPFQARGGALPPGQALTLTPEQKTAFDEALQSGDISQIAGLDPQAKIAWLAEYGKKKNSARKDPHRAEA